MDKNQAFTDGMAANAALAAASEKLVRLREQRRLLDAALPAIKADAETKIIEDAGGWKDYGSNDTERKRKLELAMAGDVAYTSSLERVSELGLQIDLQSIVVEQLRRDVRLYTALAGGYSINISGGK